MWFVATIAGYRTVHVWFVRDVDMRTDRNQFVPGMYVLKGETELDHLGKPLVIKTKRLIVPTSYMAQRDVDQWMRDFAFGYPIPFEFVCFPILTTVSGEWVEPTATPFVQFLTQPHLNTNNKLQFQPQRPHEQPNVTMVPYKEIINIGCEHAIDDIFAQYRNTVLTCCDIQLRKVVFLGVMHEHNFSAHIYCHADHCFCYRPCSLLH